MLTNPFLREAAVIQGKLNSNMLALATSVSTAKQQTHSPLVFRDCFPARLLASRPEPASLASSIAAHLKQAIYYVRFDTTRLEREN